MSKGMKVNVFFNLTKLSRDLLSKFERTTDVTCGEVESSDAGFL